MKEWLLTIVNVASDDQNYRMYKSAYGIPLCGKMRRNRRSIVVMQLGNKNKY